MANKITCFRDYYHLKIYINGILHIHLNMENHDGLQSWYEGSGHRNYFIEFYRKEGEPILTGYDLKENWVEILNLLDKYI